VARISPHHETVAVIVPPLHQEIIHHSIYNFFGLLLYCAVFRGAFTVSKSQNLSSADSQLRTRTCSSGANSHGRDIIIRQLLSSFDVGIEPILGNFHISLDARRVWICGNKSKRRTVQCRWKSQTTTLISQSVWVAPHCQGCRKNDEMADVFWHALHVRS